MEHMLDIQRRRGIENLDLTGYGPQEPVWLLSDGTYVVGASRLSAVVSAWMIGTVAEIRIVQNVLARESAIRLQIAANRTIAVTNSTEPTEPPDH